MDPLEIVSGISSTLNSLKKGPEQTYISVNFTCPKDCVSYKKRVNALFLVRFKNTKKNNNLHFVQDARLSFIKPIFVRLLILNSIEQPLHYQFINHESIWRLQKKNRVSRGDKIFFIISPIFLIFLVKCRSINLELSSACERSSGISIDHQINATSEPAR